MQLSAPVSANNAVVVPLPPLDFRIAAASLTSVGESLRPIRFDADYVVSNGDTYASTAHRKQVEAALAADTLGTAIGQARRAVQLLIASDQVGASTIGGLIDTDVVAPLQKTIDFTSTINKWDVDSLRLLAANLNSVLRGSDTWRDMLLAQPKVVVGGSGS